MGPAVGSSKFCHLGEIEYRVSLYLLYLIKEQERPESRKVKMETEKGTDKTHSISLARRKWLPKMGLDALSRAKEVNE